MSGSTTESGDKPPAPPSLNHKSRSFTETTRRILSHAVWAPIVVGALALSTYAVARRASYFWSPSHVHLLLWVKGLAITVIAVAGILSAWLVFSKEERGKKDYAKFIAALSSTISMVMVLALPADPSLTEKDITNLAKSNGSVVEPHVSISEGLKQIANGAALSKGDYYIRAQGELGLEHYPEAIADFDIGIGSLTENLASAHFFKARALLAWGRYSTGKYSEALSEIQKSLRLRPDNAPALVVECASLRNLNTRPKYLADAAKACASAISEDPKNPEAYNEMGNVFLDQHQYDDAITNFDTAISWAPKMPQPWSNRAVAKHKAASRNKDSSHRQNLNESALHDVQHALNLAPKFRDALLNEATIFKALCQEDKAMQIYLQMTDDDPLDAYAWNNLGDLIESGHPQDQMALRDALSKFDRAVQIEPAFEDAWFNRGDVLYQLGDYKGAITALKSARGLNDGSDGLAWIELADAFAKEKTESEAKSAARNALKRELPEDATKDAKRILGGLQPTDWENKSPQPCSP